MNETKLIKYPRTPHLEGSRLQPGDEDLSQIPFADIAGKHLVVEEKCDGANSAISFDGAGTLLLQSRGHYLTGGYRERHYNLFKQWANIHRNALYGLLGRRYILYGEWMYAKHTVYYDRLPHYFLEFDILDRETGRFLDTHTRHEMLWDLPVVSVPVLAEGAFAAGMSGDKETHNRLIEEAALKIADRVDTIVLAQGSMAAMEEKLAAMTGKRVLSSPLLGVLGVREYLKEKGLI